MNPRLLGMALTGLLLMSVQSGLQAASFSVSPLTVTLSSRTTSALLTIKNEATREIRFEVSVMKWTQDERGEMQLTPAGDQISFFPKLLAVAPGASRNIRMGATSAAFGTAEGTYRIFIEELPDASNETTANAVAIRTRLGVPLFLSPSRIASSAEIMSVAVENGRLIARVRNTGNVHVVVSNVTWRGLDNTGTSKFEHTANGWYILAGDTRLFDQPLPPGVCAGAETVVATVALQGGTLQSRAPIPAGACPSPAH